MGDLTLDGAINRLGIVRGVDDILRPVAPALPAADVDARRPEIGGFTQTGG